MKILLGEKNATVNEIIEEIADDQADSVISFIYLIIHNFIYIISNRTLKFITIIKRTRQRVPTIIHQILIQIIHQRFQQIKIFQIVSTKYQLIKTNRNKSHPLKLRAIQRIKK